MEITQRGAPNTRAHAETACKSAGKTCHRHIFSGGFYALLDTDGYLLEGDNKYKEGPFGVSEVAGETGDWLDLGAFEQDWPESTENEV